MKFEEWMQTEGLSESTIDKYAGAIDGPLSTWSMSNKFATIPIRSILDIEQFAELFKKIASTPEFEARNKRGHHMYGAALKKYAEFLAFVSKSRRGYYVQGPYTLSITKLEAAETVEAYNPEGQEDAREKVLREVVRRRGQLRFRSKLIDVYEAKCAITGCTVLPILEAAHITPYLGPATNSVSNGLLLRADIHTLWDLGLLAIDPCSMTVWISPSVSDNTYQNLAGLTPFKPKVPSERPSLEAIKQQWSLAQQALRA
jgi:hypothetical protein